MHTRKELVIGITLFLIGVFAQIPLENQLKCRLCNNALTLDDCTKQAVCDNRTSECYMEQVITETFSVVYRGGCQSIERCKAGTPGATGKRAEGIVCSQCCAYADDCNHRLCGIRQDNLNRTQCYFCDSSKSDQASVSNARDCITLTTCDTDQVCFAHNEYHPGSTMTYRFGCQNKFLCRVLMKRVFEDMRHCLTGGNSVECNHESDMCDVCCGDGACNYGTCNAIKTRLYNLWVNGKFDNVTLTTKP